VRFQRTAFAWLLIGSGAGALMLASRGLGWPVPWAQALALHMDVMLFGWMTQFTMGTAYWMLPKHAAGPERGHDAPMAAAWVLLNAGVIFAAAGAWPLAGRLAELAAVLAFATNAIPRIKPFGAGRLTVRPSDRPPSPPAV
jgi:heme/copper-type cytochrome/quinol oxidase subunit 1